MSISCFYRIILLTYSFKIFFMLQTSIKHVFVKRKPLKPRYVQTLSDNFNHKSGDDLLNPPIKRLKRKVGLVFAYLGTAYSGLQMDTTGNQTTVESIIEKCLYNVGCIETSNLNDLKKIGWSRSSRTDKGVHCSRTVISAKLELLSSWLESGNSKIDELPPLVNQHLPPDIRMISCFRVSKSFRARKHCFWREYEYILPIDPIIKKLQIANFNDSYETLSSKFLSNLDMVLKKLEGANSYHNFHRAARRDLTKWRNRNDTGRPSNNSTKDLKDQRGFKDTHDFDQEEDDDDDDDDDDLLDNTSLDLENISDMFSGSNNTQVVTNLFQRWTPQPRDVVSKTKNVIFCCDLVGTERMNDVVVARIRVRGQSFLLHQIRVMVGTAVYFARGNIPLSVIDAALILPLHIPLPMAPAEGLLLVDSGYMFNLNQSSYFTLCPRKTLVNFPTLGQSILSPLEYEFSESFRQNSIYPEIIRTWKERGVLEEWMDFNDARYTCLPSFRMMKDTKVPMNTGESPLEPEFWVRLIESYKQPSDEARELEKERIEKERLRRHRLVFLVNHPFEKYKIPHDKTNSFESAPITNTKNNDSNTAMYKPDIRKGRNISLERKNKIKPDQLKNIEPKYPYQDFLPTGLANQMAIFFRLPPGSELNLVLRAVASLVVSGEIPIEYSTHQIIQFIEKQGGLSWLLSKPIRSDIF